MTKFASNIGYSVVSGTFIYLLFPMKRRKDKNDVLRSRSSGIYEEEAISVIKRCRLESGEVGIFEEPPYISRFPRTNEEGDPIEEIDFRSINHTLKELAEMRRFRHGMKSQLTTEHGQNTNGSRPMNEVIMTDGESNYP